MDRYHNGAFEGQNPLTPNAKGEKKKERAPGNAPNFSSAIMDE
jgi:hypothetical protein